MPSSAAEPRWIDRLVVEAVQFDLVREHGGMPGLRDEHGLEAALARPRQRLAYTPEADLCELAAVYGHGLAATEAEVVAVMLALAAGELDEDALAKWLRSRTAGAGGVSG